MSAMDLSDNGAVPAAAAAAASSPAAAAPTEAASSSPAAAAAAAASPSAAAAADSDDDDIVVNEKDLTEDAITGGDGAPPPGPKKRRGRPPAAPVDPSTRVIGADALERLNELLRRTEQFAKFVPTETVKKGKGKAASGRHHERAEEEAEDKELVADELQQAEVKQNWPDHLDQQPTSVVKDKGLPMRDYQLEALNWLIKLHDQNLNGILADEMGLGKTLESLSLLAYLKQYRNYDGPHLIIVPKSTSSNWLREVNRWTNNLSVFRFHGNQEERDALKPQVKLNSITVTTYEMVILEKSFFAKQKWKYIYIDEAHRIKNENSLLSRVVRTFSSEHRLLITGTPLQNNLHELWALLNFLVPSLFGSSEDFAEWFNVEDPAQRGEIVARLHRLLRPFLLRRLKSEVEKALLPKIETKLFVGMSAMQRAWYKKILERDIEVLNATNTSKVRLLNIVMQLRKVCNHPYLFTGAEPGPPYLEGEHIVENSSKMVLLDKLLKKLKAAGNRVLIFSQMTRILDILEDFSRYRGYNYCRIDGQTKQDERDESMEQFNAPNSEKFIFLLSTRAGGLGINLQTADTVILFDSDWNPQMDLQAMDRAHRIGQKKQVTVFRFVVEHSIEQKMVERATKKLFLDALVVQKGRLHDSEKVVNAAELQEMVRFGANRIFSGADTEVTDADIDLILSRGSEMTKAETEKLKQSTGNDLLNFSLSDKTDTNFQQFEGKDYKGYRAQQGFEFIEPAARSRKSNYDINAYYKEALRVTDKKSAKNTREFKPTQRFDYQFFQIERLDALERKDFESKQKLYNLKLAQRVKAKEEKRLKEEQEKEARRKARIANRKQRKLEERAAAAAGGAAQAASAEGAKSDDEGDDSDDDAAAAAAAPAAASASAAAAPAAAAAAASPVKDEDVVKMELDGEDIKAESAPAAAAASADTAVKMETDAAAAAADADGRRKSNRSRLSTTKDSPAPSPAPSAKAEEDAEEEGGDGGDDLEALMAEAGCLSADEQAELKRLQDEGFGTWSRRHITSLTKAMEKYGRDDLSNIKVSVEEKTPEEVEQYYFVFWKKYKMIKDWDRILKQIERGEQKLQKQKALQVVIDNKCRRFKNNYEKMTIPYPTTSQKSFTEEEDKFLIVSLHRLGYGNWEDLKTAIRSSWMFRFDWFFKTRTCGELSKRVEYLLKILEKEQSEWDDEKRRLEKKRKEKLIKDQEKIVAAAGGPSPIKKKSKSDKGDKESKDKDKSSTKKKDKSDKSDKDPEKKKKSHKDKEGSSSKSDKGDKSDKPHKSHKHKEKDSDSAKHKDKDHKSHKKDKSEKDSASSDKKKEKKDKDSSSSTKKDSSKSDKSGDAKESKKRKEHDGSSSSAAAAPSSSSKSDDKAAKKAKVHADKDKPAKADKQDKKAPTSAASAPSAAASSSAAAAPAKMSDD